MITQLTNQNIMTNFNEHTLEMAVMGLFVML